MKFTITNRWHGGAVFEAELGASYEGKPHSIQLGAAVCLAVKARANLAGANLADAYLAGANLADANLAYANLADADLADANLAYANLADADLADANLAGANLAGANLADAKWRDGIIIQRVPLFVYGTRWPVTILDEHMEIGCELHRLDEWAAFDDRRILEMDGRSALEFWRAWKEPLLAMARADGRGAQQQAT